MAKLHSEFVCQQCGFKTSSFLGKCPECGEWNSLIESSVTDKEINSRQQEINIGEKLLKLSSVKYQKIDRLSTGFSEFDRVLGGGIVKGSVVLISGDPGIGKSTILLQCAMRISGAQFKGIKDSKSSTASKHSVLYVTGEESAQQVKIRADRIGKVAEELYILPETDVESVIAASGKLNPSILIIDSIQTLTFEKLTGTAGSIGQLRECSQILQKYAKRSGVPIFIVGHVTKEGNLAGPKVLEHLVDVVLSLEGDDMHTFRLLRTNKNRFGSTFEVGVFEMQDGGMVEVSDPSGIFLEQRVIKRPGSCVVSTIAGGRPILAEIQALCTSTIFPVPTRRVTGLDFSRIQVVLAALSKAAKLSLANLDIYVSVAGGLKVIEPAADLGAALSVISAVVDKPVREGICAFGEVGLLGELRPVINTKSRINEAKRLGFGDFVTPDKFKTLEDAVSYAIHGK